MADIRKLFNTIKHLRFKQIYYRIFYTIRNSFFNKSYSKTLQIHPKPLIWEDLLNNGNSFLSKKTFNFLNIEHVFNKNIDWNLTSYGKLWTYNLNYFDFLNQKDIEFGDGLELVEDYIKNNTILKDGKESYPISLRGINWIKFLSKNSVSDNKINETLYNHYQILVNNIEYHLLGNHLLENGYSLLFGAYYFKDEIFYKKSKQILLDELDEQVLNDGAHFELSPMYHQILLNRLLDCINLIKNNPWKENDFLLFLKKKALKMLSWLQSITYRNGNIPMVNDSAYGIANESKKLFAYAESLDLQWGGSKLSDSGYRKIENNAYELFLDVGSISSKYQPGHSHSDTFNFELYFDKKPFIVDRGISTYEKNELRNIERSTISHNTVMVNELEQTDVWGGFRVGSRAEINELKEEENEIDATHNGYKRLGVKHQRIFNYFNNEIIIKDVISGKKKTRNLAFFHFHPDIKTIDIKSNTLIFKDKNIKIVFDENCKFLTSEKYQYCLGYNKTNEAIKVSVLFDSSLTTKIIM